MDKSETKIVQVFMKFENKQELESIGNKKIKLYNRFKNQAIILGDGRPVELLNGNWVYIVK